MAIQSIQVLGSGCPTCKKMAQRAERIAQELQLGVEVEYISDVSEIIKRGIMSSPVLLVNDQVALTGDIREEEIRKALQKEY